MPFDGLQASGTLTATTSGAISQTFVTAAGAQFRASFIQITASSTGGSFIDFSGATATTSAAYPLAASEVLRWPPSNLTRYPGYYTSFSILSQAGSSIVRWIAGR